MYVLMVFNGKALHLTKECVSTEAQYIMTHRYTSAKWRERQTHKFKEII